MVFATNNLRTGFILVSMSTKARLAFALLIGMWGFSYWNELSTLGTQLRIGYNYHLLLLIPAILFMIATKSRELHKSSSTNNQRGLLFLFLVSTLWMVASLANFRQISNILLISMVPCLFITTHGMKFTKIISYPLLCSLLIITTGAEIYNLYANLFIWFIVKSTVITGAEVFWEANILYVNGIQYNLLNFLSPLQHSILFITLGFIVAFFSARRITSRVLIITLYSTLPFILLSIGSSGLLQIARWLDISALLPKTIQAVAWCATVLGILFASIKASRIRKKAYKKFQSVDIDWHDQHQYSPQRWFISSLIAITILSLSPTTLEAVKNNSGESATPVTLKLPTIVPNWHGPNAISSSIWNPRFNDANGLLAKYSNDNKDTAYLFVAYKKSSINDTATNEHALTLYDNSKWTKISSGQFNASLDNGKVVNVEETIIKNLEQHRVIWSIYYLQGKMSSNSFTDRLLDSLKTISKNTSGLGYIAFATDFSTDVNSARHTLSGFLSSLEPKINEIFNPVNKDKS